MMWKYSQKEMKILLVATLLLFTSYALVLAHTAFNVASNTQLTANSVGVFAGVEENTYNTLAMQLNDREKALNEREALLVQLLERQQRENTHVLLASALIGGSLFGLILLNFYMDMRKRRSLYA